LGPELEALAEKVVVVLEAGTAAGNSLLCQISLLEKHLVWNNEFELTNNIHLNKTRLQFFWQTL
jgi:hypothetical protein